MEDEKKTTFDASKLLPNPVDMKKMFSGLDSEHNPESEEEWDQALVSVILVNKDRTRLQVAGRMFIDDADPELLGAVLGHANKAAKQAFMTTGQQIGEKSVGRLAPFLEAYLQTSTAKAQSGFEVGSFLNKGVDEPTQ